MVRINKVYTKGGDSGETSLVGGERVAKDALRIESYGTVDELNATLGLVRVALADDPGAAELSAIIGRVQNELFNLGAELATPDPERRMTSPAVEARHIEALESEIDRLNAGLPELRSFVLPGGGAPSAFFHLARTVCRRAERLVVGLAREQDVGPWPVAYLNRLSDALFVFGRWISNHQGHDEYLWTPENT